MAWYDNLSKPSKRGKKWTKNPRYDFRGNRTENSPVTEEETELKKNRVAYQRVKERMTERNVSEDCREKAKSAGVGVLVRVRNYFVAMSKIDSTNRLVAHSNFEKVKDATLLPSEMWLSKDETGLFMEKTCCVVICHFRNKPFELKLPGYVYLFGNRPVTFTESMLKGLEIIDEIEETSADECSP
jgi:hypothetical protein